MRLFRVSNPIGGTYLPDVVAGFRERYGFLEVPTKVAEYDAAKGVTFEHGKFKVSSTLAPNRAGKSVYLLRTSYGIYALRCMPANLWPIF